MYFSLLCGVVYLDNCIALAEIYFLYSVPYSFLNSIFIYFTLNKVFALISG